MTRSDENDQPRSQQRRSPVSITSAKPNPVRGLRVLVAEDDPDNQMVMAHILRRLGADPTVVANGADAIARCSEEAFHVVLMDLHMPGLNGLEACVGIRTLEGIRQPAIVALTADAMEDRQHEVAVVGLDGFLVKPLRLAELAEVLSRFRGR